MSQSYQARNISTGYEIQYSGIYRDKMLKIIKCLYIVFVEELSTFRNITVV